MTDASLPPIDIVDFRAEHYSPDGKSIVVSFATRGAAQRRAYALPVQSLYGFIADLQKLQKAPDGAPAPAAAPSVPKAAAPAPGGDAARTAAPNTVAVTVPRRWMVNAVRERNLVVMVFDPQTERQTAFALPAKSIREMAEALVKQAVALETPAPGKTASG